MKSAKLIFILFFSDGGILRAQGCYNDYGGDPDLPLSVTVTDLTPSKCRQACMAQPPATTYSGVQVSQSYFLGPLQCDELLEF